MESQISHNIADLFTARPKAYSIKTIKQLTFNNSSFLIMFLIQYDFLKFLHSLLAILNNHFFTLSSSDLNLLMFSYSFVNTFWVISSESLLFKV